MLFATYICFLAPIFSRANKAFAGRGITYQRGYGVKHMRAANGNSATRCAWRLRGRAGAHYRDHRIAKAPCWNVRVRIA